MAPAVALVLLILSAIIIIVAHILSPPPAQTLPITTHILSKLYPLTGYPSSSGNMEVLFHTNTSPIGCISYAIAKNYAYNVTSQSLYLVNETKITNATEVERLYNDVGSIYLAGTNQQELFMTENGTNWAYVTILQNQTLLCK